ncbi:MAG: MBL fold metallo-hydrolase, partial [Actinobacteria bacterium]|nr:MBL fold metallo-hydrolase [Actinomycetota bacterium]
MATVVPHVREFAAVPGLTYSVSPHIRRVLANNPSAFTFHGTGTYIVGWGKVAVIDPGPRDTAHVKALLRALRGEKVVAILVTHTHGDHSPAAAMLRNAGIDAPVYAFGPHPLTSEAEEKGEAEGKVEERSDLTFVPDVLVTTGDVIEGPGWTFDVLHTPGHISNHLCFGYREENVLFSGDHIMGWSTSIIPPPDGDVADYLASLDLVLEHDYDALWPTHGGPVREVHTYVRALHAHRLEREQQILDLLADATKPMKVPTMVKRIYVGYPKELHKP